MVAPQFRKKGKTLNPFVKKKNKSKSTKKKSTKEIIAKVVNRELTKEFEQKLQPLDTVYAGIPLNQDSSNNVVFYNNYCLGQPANTWLGPTGSPNFVGVNGFSWPQGTGNNERVGKYMHLKHTTMSFRVGLIGVPRSSSPHRFRVIVYKAKRNSLLDTAGGNPNSNLFIGLNGNELGINNSFAQNAVAYEMMNMIVNKRNYDVLHDSQFILAHPTYSVQGGSNIVSPISQGSYPTEKNFLWKLPHNEKVSFKPAANEPDDLNYQYCITVLSMPTGDLIGTGQNNWRTQVRGVVSAYDA